MGHGPNNVTRLIAELHKHGFRDTGVSFDKLDPTYNVEGTHEYYPEILSMSFDLMDPKRECSLNFGDRHTERAVHMYGYVHVDRLMALCKALVDTHKSMSRVIKVEAIVTVTTAVAVCEAMRGGGDG